MLNFNLIWTASFPVCYSTFLQYSKCDSFYHNTLDCTPFIQVCILLNTQTITLHLKTSNHRLVPQAPPDHKPFCAQSKWKYSLLRIPLVPVCPNPLVIWGTVQLYII